MLADLLNEYSGYLLGDGDAAKVAIENANATLLLEGKYVEDVFDLVLIVRKKALLETSTCTWKNKQPTAPASENSMRSLQG